MFGSDLLDILIHPLSGRGYQFWSGVGGHATVAGTVVLNILHRHHHGKHHER